MGMGGGVGEDVADDSLREFSGWLIFFEDDDDPFAALDVFALFAVHEVIPAG